MKRREIQAVDLDGDEVLLRVTRTRNGVERLLLSIDGRPQRRAAWDKVEDLSVEYHSPSEFRAIALLLESPYV